MRKLKLIKPVIITMCVVAPPPSLLHCAFIVFMINKYTKQPTTVNNNDDNNDIIIILHCGFLYLYMHLFFILVWPLVMLGTAVAQWLRCCATNRKVAGSIPAGVIGFLIDIKSF